MISIHAGYLNILGYFMNTKTVNFRKISLKY